jgi:hypothetical protein
MFNVLYMISLTGCCMTYGRRLLFALKYLAHMGLYP